MEDLIKREDALKELRLDNKDVIYIDKTECARRIKAIPSADTEIEIIKAEAFAKGIDSERKRISDWCRPSGEWQYIAQGWHSIRRCSNCKWTQSYSDPKYLGYRYNFCPNCGAKMKGAENEID